MSIITEERLRFVNVTIEPAKNRFTLIYSFLDGSERTAEKRYYWLNQNFMHTLGLFISNVRDELDSPVLEVNSVKDKLSYLFDWDRDTFFIDYLREILTQYPYQYAEVKHDYIYLIGQVIFDTSLRSVDLDRDRVAELLKMPYQLETVKFGNKKSWKCGGCNEKVYCAEKVGTRYYCHPCLVNRYPEKIDVALMPTLVDNLLRSHSDFMSSKSTVLNGIIYRSKSEAYLAKIFDAFDLDFYYEPVVSNIGYQPDFYLPRQNLFVELKPMDKYGNRELSSAYNAFLQSIQEGKVGVDGKPAGLMFLAPTGSYIQYPLKQKSALWLYYNSRGLSFSDLDGLKTKKKEYKSEFNLLPFDEDKRRPPTILVDHPFRENEKLDLQYLPKAFNSN